MLSFVRVVLDITQKRKKKNHRKTATAPCLDSHSPMFAIVLLFIAEVRGQLIQPMWHIHVVEEYSVFKECAVTHITGMNHKLWQLTYVSTNEESSHKRASTPLLPQGP